MPESPLIIVSRDKDICPECMGEIYEADYEVFISEYKRWGKAPGFECLCGNWLLDRDGNRVYVTVEMDDPEHVDTLREIADKLKGTVDAQDAADRIERMLMEG